MWGSVLRGFTEERVRMQCQHLPGLGRSGGERTVPKKRMEQDLLLPLTRLAVSYSSIPAWAGGASQTSTRISPSGLPRAGEGMGAGGGCWCHPPLVAFGFKSLSVHPPASISQKRKRNQRRQAGCAQPWHVSPRPGRPQPPQLPQLLSQQSPAAISLQTSRLSHGIVSSPVPASPVCIPSLHPLPTSPASIPCPHPLPASIVVGAGRGHSFCLGCYFTPQRAVISATAFFRSGR